MHSFCLADKGGTALQRARHGCIPLECRSGIENARRSQQSILVDGTHRIFLFSLHGKQRHVLVSRRKRTHTSRISLP